ncbi:hypothetical protein K9K77_03115 [Candidatus Babeliales bacterium]|nr:hypothetical protein [Candidatus Babeliales bacterium]
MKFNNLFLVCITFFATSLQSIEWSIIKINPSNNASSALRIASDNGLLFLDKKNNALSMCVNIMARELNKDLKIQESFKNFPINNEEERNLNYIVLLMEAFRVCKSMPEFSKQ